MTDDGFAPQADEVPPPNRLAGEVAPNELSKGAARPATDHALAPSPTAIGWLSPTPATRTSTRPIVAGAIVAAIVAVVILGAGSLSRGLPLGSSNTSTHTLVGSLELNDPATTDISPDGKACQGNGQWAAIKGGATMTLKDGPGDVISQASLSQGTFTGGLCILKFGFVGVPEVPVYIVEGPTGAGFFETVPLSLVAADGWTLTPMQLGV